MHGVPLCHLDDLTDGESKGFDPNITGQDTIIVVRQSLQVYIYSNSCPHLDTPLAWRKDAYLNKAADRIVCYAHGALFDISSGICLLGPCLGQRLTSIPFHIDKKGFIFLDS
ncbi:Rieske (2Fe-2S) domain-containing protein [Pseudomonas sp. M47T1]|uniref:Rieske (2Fe-2S) protein n=1 Tax=Pseudomonas sp. M47T1 TaxID=1179778 RepID=UPI000260733A|nr:Rieske (2Fe-2S) protein [Pseudomonas sp. M47T1]EIK94135.1 Rieske (2Fe-2S) domain-containing protein [Pseudomonas sp. M47T1]